MPLELKYNEKHNYIIVSAKGNATINDAEIIMSEIVASNDFSSNVNSLWDLREFLFDHVDIGYVKQFITIRKKYNELRGEAKIAMLSDSFLAVPIVKLYTILSGELSQKNKVFRTIEEAEDWLRE